MRRVVCQYLIAWFFWTVSPTGHTTVLGEWIEQRSRQSVRSNIIAAMQSKHHIAPCSNDTSLLRELRILEQQ